jgi:hypothetical protein
LWLLEWAAVPKQVLSAQDEVKDASFNNNQAHARTAMLCQAMGTEAMAQCGCDNNKYFGLSNEAGEQGVGAFRGLNANQGIRENMF